MLDQTRQSRRDLAIATTLEGIATDLSAVLRRIRAAESRLGWQIDTHEHPKDIIMSLRGYARDLRNGSLRQAESAAEPDDYILSAQRSAADLLRRQGVTDPGDLATRALGHVHATLAL